MKYLLLFFVAFPIFTMSENFGEYQYKWIPYQTKVFESVKDNLDKNEYIIKQVEELDNGANNYRATYLTNMCNLIVTEYQHGKISTKSLKMNKQINESTIIKLKKYKFKGRHYNEIHMEIKKLLEILEL